jgi:oxygen-dependent protoporphyrinogen oxidase
VQPLVGGIYTGDPERLSLRATLPRFLEMEREHRSVALAGLKKGRAESGGTSGARYGLFVSPKSGMGTFIARLVERVKASAKVRVSTSATRLEPLASGHRVHLANGEALEADAVIVALPAFAAGALLEASSRKLADELVAIPYASSAVVVSGHALADVKHPLDAFGLVIPHVERRKILAVSFASRKLADRAPRGSVQLRTFVGGAMQPELYELSDARIEGIVLDELHAILGVDGTPDFVRVMRHRRAMPQYLVGHLERVARIEEAARAIPGLALAGSAYRGVGVPDCVRSAELAAEAVALGNAASSRRGS